MSTIDPVFASIARVTPENIEDNIAFETYFTANHGVAGKAVLEAQARGDGEVPSISMPAELQHVTLCVIMMTNGTKIVGVNHGPIVASGFNAEVGRQLARKHAVDQIYPLLGFALREALLDAS